MRRRISTTIEEAIDSLCESPTIKTAVSAKSDLSKVFGMSRDAVGRLLLSIAESSASVRPEMNAAAEAIRSSMNPESESPRSTRMG